MKNILLIDDEQTILHGLTTLIDWPAHGFALKGAFSKPLEALDFFDRHTIDIVITDLMMPELNGIELSRLLKKQRPDTQILVLSSYDDFHLVKDSFKEGVSDYLLKPKLNSDSLLNALHSLANDPKKKTSALPNFQERISDYTSNYLSGISSADPLVKESFPHERFFLLYCEEAHEQKYQRIAKNKEIATHYTTDALSIFPFATTTNDTGFLINSKDGEALQSFIDLFREDHPENDCLYVLSEEIYFPNFCDHFATLKQRSKGQIFYLSTQLLITEQQLIPLLISDEEPTKSYLTKILNKDFISAIEELQTYLKKASNLKLQPSYLKHETINRLYALISGIAEEQEPQNEISMMKITVPTLITNAKHWEDFTAIVDHAINRLLEVTMTLKKDNSEILTLIYEYVQENYQQEISLQAISEKYHFSYSYLSTIFTEKYGINFTKYLKKVRINHAKKLLVKTSAPLSEICSKTGFSEIGYFSRVFKEETGITPSHYRKGKLKL
ncbi:MAG: helix-turn-helix domain-containing protein [Enterococcus sp.]